MLNEKFNLNHETVVTFSFYAYYDISFVAIIFRNFYLYSFFFPHILCCLIHLLQNIFQREVRINTLQITLRNMLRKKKFTEYKERKKDNTIR